MPASGIKLHQFAKRELIRPARAVRRTFQGIIVQKKHFAIGTQFGITFKGPITKICSQAKSSQCIFRCLFAGTAVSPINRIRPFR